MSTRAHRHPARTLATRLLTTQALVIAAMALTVMVVAVSIGPPVFNAHMAQTGHSDQPLVLQHAREAFFIAGFTALAVGSVVAGLGALALSRRLTHRFTDGLDALQAGADRVATGHYDQPVDVPELAELSAVASAFNQMAAELDSTETRRRRLLTDIGHELRTPIATIQLTLEGWAEGIVEPDAEVLAALRAQSERLARLAADLRDVSAAEEGRLHIQPVATTTTEVIDAAVQAATTRFAAAGVHLTTRITDLPLYADLGRIGQVLDNLLSNALRHTETGGRVAITTTSSAVSTAITVTDDGEGIAAEDLDHVFERFYRADAARSHRLGQGTGVGLAISRAIARAHGGDLTGDSAGQGRGARFTLTLPR